MDDALRPARDDVEAVFPLGKLDTGDGLDAQVDELARRIEPFAGDDLTVAWVAPDWFVGEYEGVEGYREGWKSWLESFDSYESRLEDIEAGPEVTVFLTRQLARGPGSTVEMETESAAVVFWRRDRVRRVEFHLDRKTAREAAGLRSG